MDEEKKGFVIKDKRMFDESGKTRDEEPGPQPEKRDETKETAGPSPEGTPEETSEEEQYLPEITFSSFVISLSTTALFHFGDFPDPSTNKAVKNLVAAKQLIDTLSMIEAKTKGNLDQNEKNLIEGVLFELRMRYVKETS